MPKCIHMCTHMCVYVRVCALLRTLQRAHKVLPCIIHETVCWGDFIAYSHYIIHVLNISI